MAKSFVTDIDDFTPSNDFQVPENIVEENLTPNNEVPDFTIDIDNVNMEGPKIDAVDPFVSTVKHYDSSF